VRREDRCVVRTADVLFGAARVPPVADRSALAKNLSALVVDRRPFLIREELPAGEARGALEGDFNLVGPEALQVRIAPRRAERRVVSRWPER